MSEEKPKIIVDDDWKTQAKKEKEQLAQEAEKKAQEQQPREMPPANLTSLISMLATNTIYALGGMQDPSKGKVMVDPVMAKHYIDTMDMLKEKTEGNRSDEEDKVLEEAISQTKMLFVQITQQIQNNQAKPAEDAEKTDA